MGIICFSTDRRVEDSVVEERMTKERVGKGQEPLTDRGDRVRKGQRLPKEEEIQFRSLHLKTLLPGNRDLV